MDVLKFQYMHKNSVAADVTVDRQRKSVVCVNYSDDILCRPFGINCTPSMADVGELFESRCFPRERRNCDQLLADLGLDHYSPLEIVRKTHGRQLEDYCWIKFDGEDLDYERDIKLRD